MLSKKKRFLVEILLLSMILVGCKKNTGDLIGTYLVNDSIKTRLTFSEDGYYDWIQKGSYQYEGNSKFLITYSDDITSELEVDENINLN